MILNLLEAMIFAKCPRAGPFKVRLSWPSVAVSERISENFDLSSVCNFEVRFPVCVV